MALELGRQGRLYVGLHTAYGDTPTPASTDALRHVMFLPSHDPTNKRNSPEKQFAPQHFTRFSGREVANLRQLTCLLRPSGTINTLSEASEVLEAVFGSKTNTTLSTTVASGSAVGGATLTSGTGLAVNDFLLITCLDGIKRARRITAANTGTGVTTWAPNLPSIPAVGAAVKCGTTYKMTTANAVSFWLAHYLKKTDGTTAGLIRLLRGIAADRFSLAIDATEEAQFTVSGPAQTLLTDATPTIPAGFTAVGNNPPPGYQTELLIGSSTYSTYLFIKAAIEINNALRLRNNEAGAGASNTATESYRAGRPDISLSLDARVETQATVYDLAEAGTNTGVFIQQGFTEGNIWAMAMPQVEFKVPDTGDEDEELNWPFKGTALASADALNDAIFLALL